VAAITSLEDAGYPDVRKLAAYTQYASLVPPSGLLQRKTMLISPAFNGVWSWDHCFNAMALASGQPHMAWDQLMVPFDYQDEHGALPDYVKDQEMVWNFTKPPIHGWTLRRMLERTNEITNEQLEAFYPKLAAWTEWWFKYRDYDGNGIPQYNHGNDSGWDNALVFQEAGAIESPDLSAFLVIQMDVLAEVADRIGRSDEASEWRERSHGFLAKMLDYFWNGEKFIAKRSGTGDIIDTDSLLHWIPIVLGSRLPKEIIHRMASVLGPNGPFLTEWGPATESPASTFYRPDGYWRGPIWAPSTFMLADGLKHAGETALAAEIARRFCRLCEAGGMAENYNALTGEGQRDRFHTWPASVFLMFAHDFV
jgi:putative isomerase